MSQAGSITGFNTIRVENALVPNEGPKIIPVNLDFALAAEYRIDFTLSVMQNKIEIIQGVYIDNSRNAQVFTLTADATKQEISVPAGAQGYYPCLAGEFPKFVGSSAGSTSAVYLAFINVPVPAIQWNSGIGGSIGAVNQGAAGTQAWLVQVQNASGTINSANPLIVAPADPVITAVATIASAASVSNFITIPEGYVLSTLMPPSAWDTANIWLQGSHDGATAANIRDANGNNLVIPFGTTFAAGIPPALVTGWPFIRLQSVNTATPTTPVNQTAARSIGYSLARVV